MPERWEPRDRLVQHELKTWPEFFGPVFDGTKTFELRKSDRDYRVGDELYLREWHPTGGYTGRACWRLVTYCATAGHLAGLDAGLIKPGYVLLGIRESKHEPGVADDPPVPSSVLDGVTVAGARAFWKAQDLLNAIQAMATDSMVALSDPHRTAEEYRAALVECCQAALRAIDGARPMEPHGKAEAALPTSVTTPEDPERTKS